MLITGLSDRFIERVDICHPPTAAPAYSSIVDITGYHIKHPQHRDVPVCSSHCQNSLLSACVTFSAENKPQKDILTAGTYFRSSPG